LIFVIAVDGCGYRLMVITESVLTVTPDTEFVMCYTRVYRVIMVRND